MSKLEQLQENIWEIGKNSNWYHVSQCLQTALNNGALGVMKAYLKGVEDVVYIKGCPRKIAECLKNIKEILA